MRCAIALLSVLPVVAASAAAAPERGRLPQKELAAERYALVTDPEKLPLQVRDALARELKQPQLSMAPASGRYIATDEISPDDRKLPMHRLVLAAVGQRFAVVHYESGGYASSRTVTVFELGARGTEAIWSEKVKRRISAPIEFEQALRDGSLFDPRLPARD